MGTNEMNTRVFDAEWKAEEFYNKVAGRPDVGRVHMAKRTYQTIMRETFTYWEVSYSIWDARSDEVA